MSGWADEWAAIMSTREHTHSVSGRRLVPDWKPEDAVAILDPVVSVARRAVEGQGLYLLVES
jgi:hypothetical protein